MFHLLQHAMMDGSTSPRAFGEPWSPCLKGESFNSVESHCSHFLLALPASRIYGRAS